MLNSASEDYYSRDYGAFLSNYINNKAVQDTKLNYILAFIIICILMATLALIRPLIAQGDTGGNINLSKSPPGNIVVYDRVSFENNIKQKYQGNSITFPAAGVAHIKKTKYINSKPIKINIVELNTNVNPYLKIKPQTASEKLNSKTTVRKIAQKDQAVVAINGGFFKPSTGVPLGALMIDGKVLTGSIYNRVGIAIFENKHKTSFKMENINFDIKAKTQNYIIKVDNINQPRMLSTYMLLYTSDWGKTSPIAPKNGSNLLIRNHKAIKMSANPVEMAKGDMVLQGNKSTLSKLAKDGNIYIDLKIQEGFEDAKHIISAGPYLVKNSKVFVDAQSQKLQAISGKNPRSAIGYKSDGTFIIVTVDGREQKSVGMTLFELANLMKELKCEWAMNFDGGSSSAMYVKGKITNSAINKEGIYVSNALVVTEVNPYEMQLAGL